MKREWQTEIQQAGEWRKVGGLCVGTLGCLHAITRNSLQDYPMRARNVRSGEVCDREQILGNKPRAR